MSRPGRGHRSTFGDARRFIKGGTGAEELESSAKIGLCLASSIHPTHVLYLVQIVRATEDHAPTPRTPHTIYVTWGRSIFPKIGVVAVLTLCTGLDNCSGIYSGSIVEIYVK